MSWIPQAVSNSPLLFLQTAEPEPAALGPRTAVPAQPGSVQAVSDAPRLESAFCALSPHPGGGRGSGPWGRGLPVTPMFLTGRTCSGWAVSPWQAPGRIWSSSRSMRCLCPCRALGAGPAWQGGHSYPSLTALGNPLWV